MSVTGAHNESTSKLRPLQGILQPDSCNEALKPGNNQEFVGEGDRFARADFVGKHRRIFQLLPSRGIQAVAFGIDSVDLKLFPHTGCLVL